LDGSDGVLFISCTVPSEGTPESVFEGVSASKNFVDYCNIIPLATVFHFED
jgi:hypothetical protein